MVFGGWMVPLAAFLLARDSEWYKEWRDPPAYWGAKVTAGEAWVKDSKETIVDCTRQLAAIRSEAGRSTWTAAKKLEGRSDAEAAQDYAIEIRSQEYACDGMRKLLEASERMLEKDRAKLRAATR